MRPGGEELCGCSAGGGNTSTALDEEAVRPKQAAKRRAEASDMRGRSPGLSRQSSLFWNCHARGPRVRRGKAGRLGQFGGIKRAWPVILVAQVAAAGMADVLAPALQTTISRHVHRVVAVRSGAQRAIARWPGGCSWSPPSCTREQLVEDLEERIQEVIALEHLLRLRSRRRGKIISERFSPAAAAPPAKGVSTYGASEGPGSGPWSALAMLTARSPCSGP